jgi:hypothetical protein
LMLLRQLVWVLRQFLHDGLVVGGEIRPHQPGGALEGGGRPSEGESVFNT